jgi:crossover junction endodeoxyribonuclease RuvC
MRIVMGIDPGLANTGFGVVRMAGQRAAALDAGVIETGVDEPLEQRLEIVHSSVAELLAWHEPEALALEDLYFGKNVRSAMKVGQARGVVMLAAAERGIPCFDYTPQAVKMSVCGSGAADKSQVQHMVATLLNLTTVPASDHAADALAVAICHASQSPQMISVRRTSTAGAATPASRAAAG